MKAMFRSLWLGALPSSHLLGRRTRKYTIVHIWNPLENLADKLVKQGAWIGRVDRVPRLQVAQVLRRFLQGLLHTKKDQRHCCIRLAKSSGAQKHRSVALLGREPVGTGFLVNQAPLGPIALRTAACGVHWKEHDRDDSQLSEIGAQNGTPEIVLFRHRRTH